MYCLANPDQFLTGHPYHIATANALLCDEVVTATSMSVPHCGSMLSGDTERFRHEHRVLPTCAFRVHPLSVLAAAPLDMTGVTAPVGRLSWWYALSVRGGEVAFGHRALPLLSRRGFVPTQSRHHMFVLSLMLPARTALPGRQASEGAHDDAARVHVAGAAQYRCHPLRPYVLGSDATGVSPRAVRTPVVPPWCDVVERVRSGPVTWFSAYITGGLSSAIPIRRGSSDRALFVTPTGRCTALTTHPYAGVSTRGRHPLRRPDHGPATTRTYASHAHPCERGILHATRWCGPCSSRGYGHARRIDGPRSSRTSPRRSRGRACPCRRRDCLKPCCATNARRASRRCCAAH